MAVAGAFLGAGVQFGLQGVWKAGVSVYKGLSGSDCKKLEDMVNNLLPIVKEICDSSQKLPTFCDKINEGNQLVEEHKKNGHSSPRSLPDSSLQKFPKFRDKISEGNQLVEEYKKCRNPIRKIWINERIKKLDKSINKFIQNDLQVVMLQVQLYLSTQMGVMVNVKVSLSAQLETVSEGVETALKAMETIVRDGVETMSEGVETALKAMHTIVRDGVESMGDRVEIVRDRVETGVQTLREAVETGVQTLHQEVKNLISKIEEQQIERSQQDESLCGPPDTPSNFLGFDDHIQKLKKFLLEDGVNVVGVTAMGGAGKSTLAKAVCKDHEIREYFKQRVIYIVASESPDPLNILKTMWRNIVSPRDPDFRNVEDAHNKLESQIKSIKKPTLVVLDDIWSKSHLEELLFEGEQYATLVTTRDRKLIPKGPKARVYKLPLLQPEDALSLFCHCAFGKPTIPSDQDKKLVEKVQQKCDGLPLALKVIGSSLYGESDSVWERAEKMLSAGEPFKDDHKDFVLNKLKTSIDVLEDKEKQCFLDLGAFPQRKAIPAKALLDIWVYVRRMNSDQADMLLWKFADRHLLDLKKNPGTAENTDDCMDGYFFSQHDVMRDLALYLANQDNRTECRRLFMPKMEDDFPRDWETDRVISSRAQIVSIHTGAMKDVHWPEMEFPEAEALVLYFTASEYCIPTFLHTMKKLKVLIIHNTDGAKRSKLSGVATFQKLSQLKTLHLEKVIVPEECKVLKSLEKIHMILCEGLGRDKTFDFPRLLEFNVGYCIDLEELPAGLCSSIFLKILSITHCHRLAKLPDEVDKLESLKEIRLCESLGLQALPSSICSLRKLKLLDISSCLHLKVKRGVRCELKETLQALAKLASLKRVICDKKNEWLFEGSSRADLKVQAVGEKEHNLDWLDWKGGN